MNRSRAPFALRALAIVTLTACAPSADTRPDTAAADTGGVRATNWAADSAAIVAAGDSNIAAWNRGDADAYLAAYVDTAIIMSGGAGKPPLIYRSVAEARPSYVKQLGGAHGTVRWETLLLRPLGPDAVLEVSRYTSTHAGAPEFHGAFSGVWIRTPAGWRILLDHAG